MSDVSLTSSVRTNLLLLQNTQTSIDRTQTRLATGNKINSAIDGPQSFFAAQGLNQRAGDLLFLKDGLGQAISTINAADAAVTAIEELVEQARGIAQSARNAQGDDESAVTERQSLSDQFNAIIAQVNDLTKDASYAGRNLTIGNGRVLGADESTVNTVNSIVGVSNARVTNVAAVDSYNIEVTGTGQITGDADDIAKAAEERGLSQVSITGFQSFSSGNFDNIEIEVFGGAGEDKSITVTEGDESSTQVFSRADLLNADGRFSYSFSSGTNVTFDVNLAKIESVPKTAGEGTSLIEKKVDLQVKVQEGYNATTQSGSRVINRDATNALGAGKLANGENAFVFGNSTVRLDIDEATVLSSSTYSSSVSGSYDYGAAAIVGTATLTGTVDAGASQSYALTAERVAGVDDLAATRAATTANTVAVAEQFQTFTVAVTGTSSTAQTSSININGTTVTFAATGTTTSAAIATGLANAINNGVAEAFQTNTVSVTGTSSTGQTSTLVVNGTTVTYTSVTGSTSAQIAAGIAAAVNANAAFTGLVTASATGGVVTLVSDVSSTAFTVGTFAGTSTAAGAVAQTGANVVGVSAGTFDGVVTASATGGTITLTSDTSSSTFTATSFGGTSTAAGAITQTAANVTPVSAVAQVDTFTYTGSAEEGEIIGLIVNNTSYEYTVKEGDTLSSALTSLSNLVTIGQSGSVVANGNVSTGGTATITLTASTAGTGFTASSNIKNLAETFDVSLTNGNSTVQKRVSGEGIQQVTFSSPQAQRNVLSFNTQATLAAGETTKVTIGGTAISISGGTGGLTAAGIASGLAAAINASAASSSVTATVGANGYSVELVSDTAGTAIPAITSADAGTVDLVNEIVDPNVATQFGDGVTGVTLGLSVSELGRAAVGDTTNGAYTARFDVRGAQTGRSEVLTSTQLVGGSTANNVRVQFNERNTSDIIVESVNIQTDGLGLRLDEAANEFRDFSDIDKALANLDFARSELRSAAASFGTNLNIIQTRETFTVEFANVLQEGADKLTLADQNEEGAKLLSLQTRQQLGTISLSIANQSQQAILRLF